MKILEEDMGYDAKLDEDGVISFNYEMKTICVMTGDDPEPYVTMLYPQFCQIKEGKETLVLTVCNKLTRELKLAKVYVDHTLENVTAECGFYFSGKKSLRLNIEKSLDILGVIRMLFRDNIDELSIDD